MILQPDFQVGFQEGLQAFKDGIFFPEHNKTWTEEDIIVLVEKELTGIKYRREKRYETLQGQTPLSYLHHLGFIVGYVHQALDSNTITA